MIWQDHHSSRKSTFISTRLWYYDVIKWKHFLRYCPFVRGIHLLAVNSPRKGRWSGAFMLYLICAWTNGWANSREAGDLRRHGVHYDAIVMPYQFMNLLLQRCLDLRVNSTCIMARFPIRIHKLFAVMGPRPQRVKLNLAYAFVKEDVD